MQVFTTIYLAETYPADVDRDEEALRFDDIHSELVENTRQRVARLENRNGQVEEGTDN